MKKIALFLAFCMLLTCTGCAVPAPEDPVLPAAGNIQQTLDAIDLAQTTAPVVLGPGEYEISEEKMTCTAGAPLVAEMATRESNPIALFLELVRSGDYVKQDQHDGFQVAVWYDDEATADQVFSAIPDPVPMTVGEGTDWEELFCQTLRMSALVDDRASLESALLNRIENYPGDTVAYSEADQCCYSYYVCFDSASAYILTVYYQDSGIELQSLWLYYKEGGYAGASTGWMYAENAWAAQTASLICALEKLVAGQSALENAYQGCDEFACYELPGTYALGQWQAEISTHSYYSEIFAQESSYIDSAKLVNYRISR